MDDTCRPRGSGASLYDMEEDMKKLEEKLRRFSVGTRLVGAVAPKELSKAIGQKKENLLKAKALGYPLRIRGKEGILPGEVEISVENPYNLK